MRMSFVSQVPWWALGVYIGTVFSMWSFFKAPRDQPPSSWVIVVWLLFAFIMAVSWIIILANEVGMSTSLHVCPVASRGLS